MKAGSGGRSAHFGELLGAQVEVQGGGRTISTRGCAALEGHAGGAGEREEVTPGGDLTHVVRTEQAISMPMVRKEPGMAVHIGDLARRCGPWLRDPPGEAGFWARVQAGGATDDKMRFDTEVAAGVQGAQGIDDAGGSRDADDQLLAIIFGQRAMGPPAVRVTANLAQPRRKHM